MWGSIETGTFGSVVAQTVVPSLNRHPAATELADPATILDSPRLMPAVGAPAARNRMAAASSRIVRIAAIGAAAGFITGFITLGGGSRIAMRIAAMLSEDELRGTLTENDQRVGEITFSGTWELLLTGGFFGLGLGLAFVLIRAYLPGSGRRRVLTSGAVFFAVCGFATLEGGGNRDYERFGIAGLNVCLFTILPLLFGLLIVPVFRSVGPANRPQLPRLSRSPRALLVSGALLFGFVVSIQGMMVLLDFPAASALRRDTCACRARALGWQPVFCLSNIGDFALDVACRAGASLRRGADDDGHRGGPDHVTACHFQSG